MARSLVIAEEGAIARTAVDVLIAAGHAIHREITGTSGLATARTGAFCVIVVAAELPDIGAAEFVRLVRGRGDRTPVLAVGSLATVEARVASLRAGCDALLAEPVTAAELAARVERLLARPAGGRATRLTYGDLSLDLVAGRASRDGRPLHLLPQEVRLLECLLRRAGAVVPRAVLAAEVWGPRQAPRSNALAVHMGHLCRKVDPLDAPPLIRTVRGQGYLLGSCAPQGTDRHDAHANRKEGVAGRADSRHLAE